MAVEQYANAPVTTLNGAINNSVTSLVVTSASAFPTSGDFRIIIDTEIMLVTAVSGTTFTVTRGVEGTAAASHSNGATITCSLTKQSLLNLFRDGVGKGTFANRPSPGREGRLYYATDVPGIISRDNGSAWENIFGTYGPYPELDISFYPTWVNQQNATMTQYGGCMRLEDDGTNNSGEDLRLRLKSKTGTNTAQVSIGCRTYNNARQACVFGIAFRESSTGYILGFGGLVRGGDPAPRCAMIRWTDYNNYSGTHIEQESDLAAAPLFYRAKWTGSSNFEFYISKDGQKWSKLMANTDTNLSGFDQIGLFIDHFNPVYTDGSAPFGMDVFYLDHVET